MNGYVMVGTNDLTSAKKFYDKLLNVLNIKAIYSDDVCIGYANDGNDDVEFYVTNPINKEKATFGNGAQISFLVNSKELVNKFYNTGIKLGGADEGAPGIRSGDYYCYFRDLDKNKICAFTKISN